MLPYATLGACTPHTIMIPGVQLPAARDVSNKALHTVEVLFSMQLSGGCFRGCDVASSLISKGNIGFCKDCWLKSSTIRKEISSWQQKLVIFAKGKARKQKKQPWWRKKEAKEEISCLVKTIVTCLRKQRGADNSRRNVSRGSHRNGTQSFLWQVNLLQEPNVFRNSLSSGSCLLLKLPQKSICKALCSMKPFQMLSVR